MRWSSMPSGAAAARIGLAGGSVTAGLGGVLAIGHHPWAAVAAVSLAMTPIIANSIAQIIRASGEAQAARIRARGDADALALRTRTQARLLQAGLRPDREEQAAKMLVLQSINADLPADRRLKDDAIIKLLLPLTRLLTEGAATPRSPSNGPGSGRGKRPRDVVVPLHRDLDELSARISRQHAPREPESNRHPGAVPGRRAPSAGRGPQAGLSSMITESCRPRLRTGFRVHGWHRLARLDAAWCAS
jgi:hypothetical protein